jgi:hypothetical protein
VKPLRLINDGVRSRAIELIKKSPDEPVYEMVLRQAESLRSIEQNAKAHAMLSDISKQVTWHGVKLSVEVWKRLTIAAMLREIGEKPILVPALDGCGIDIIYEKSSKLGVKKTVLWIEWLYMFGAENNVVWKDPSDAANSERK